MLICRTSNNLNYDKFKIEKKKNHSHLLFPLFSPRLLSCTFEQQNYCFSLSFNALIPDLESLKTKPERKSLPQILMLGSRFCYAVCRSKCILFLCSGLRSIFRLCVLDLFLQTEQPVDGQAQTKCMMRLPHHHTCL